MVKFEFGHGPMIFDRVMPFDKIFSFHLLSPQRYYISTQIEHMDMARNAQVKFEFGHGSIFQSYAPLTLRNAQIKLELSQGLIVFLAELCPFPFENNKKFPVSVHYVSNGITHSTQI
jgi:hypothetical protein